MNIPLVIRFICGFILILCLFGCGSSPTTPTPTATLLPTSIPRPTLQPNFLADPQTACFLHNNPAALSCLDGDGWHVYFPEEPVKYPRAITRCSDGSIYIGVRGSFADEVYRLEGDTLVDLEYFPASPIDKIVCGHGNEIWVISYGYVSHFDGSEWTFYQPDEHLGNSKYVGDIVTTSTGKVWVRTDKSIATFDGVQWQVFSEGHDAEFKIPSAIGVDANGQVWVANSDAELLKYDGTQWSTVADLEGTISTITFDAQNRLWVGTWDGILVFDPETNSVVDRFGAGTLDGRDVIAMQFDRSNRLWVVTNYGFTIYDGSVWTTYHMYNSNIFADTADQVFVFGDGPRLPAKVLKAPGSVRGKLVNSEGAPYTNIQVEICAIDVRLWYSGDTPCGDQSYHVLIEVAANGEFAAADVPVGHYYLVYQKDKYKWANGGEFDVHPGDETQLGEIDTTK